MGQSLSIRFQTPKDLTGPARDLFAELLDPLPSTQGSFRDDSSEIVQFSISKEQEALSVRDLRRQLRRLEKERTLKTADGTATWIVTDRICFDPTLGTKVKTSIVGEGLGKGRIIYGPHDFRLAPGYYMAIIEFQVTNMLEARHVRIAGEVSLNNKRYLSQQTKTVFTQGSHVFRLPFRLREAIIMDHSTAAIEVRLNVKGIIGLTVSQVAVVYKAAILRNVLAHPIAHLTSAANAWVRAVGRKIVTRRAAGKHGPASS